MELELGNVGHLVSARIGGSMVLASVSKICEAGCNHLYLNGPSVSVQVSSVRGSRQDARTKALAEIGQSEFLTSVVQGLLVQQPLAEMHVQVCIQQLEEDPNILATCVNAAVASLLAAGIPMIAVATGVTCSTHTNSIVSVISNDPEQSVRQLYHVAGRVGKSHDTLEDCIATGREIAVKYVEVMRTFIASPLITLAKVASVNCLLTVDRTSTKVS